MDNNETSWLKLPHVKENDSSHLNSHTEALDPIYVFTPAGVFAKRALCLTMSAIGVMGFLGNFLLLYFLCQKPTKTSNRFIRNLKMYGKSRSLADTISCVASLPLFCIQISFDVFQSGWACKIVRYCNIAFPTIAFNHLIPISFEKYLSTRSVPRTLYVSTARKIIICAWILGIVIPLFPMLTFEGLRVDLNKTHYTIVCKYNQDYYPFQLSIILIPLHYLLPIVFVAYVNICLIKTIWTRQRRRFADGVSDAFKTQLRAKSIKGTTLLLVLTFVFFIPHLFYLADITYTQIARPQRQFSTEYIIRYATGGVAAYFSILINFIIFYFQMEDFQVFLKNLLCGRCDEISTGERRAGPRPLAAKSPHN